MPANNDDAGRAAPHCRYCGGGSISLPEHEENCVMRNVPRYRRHIGTFTEPATADYVGVVRFARAMEDKLTRKRIEGRRGWNLDGVDGCTVDELRAMLDDHIDKSDMVDIANFAMMIWNRENPNGF